MSTTKNIELVSLQPTELSQWLTHLTNTFASKGTKREYFERHVTNDPSVDFHGIMVIKENGVICSSVRVFNRICWINGKQVAIGGIGEVIEKQ
jgi:hypothetical protein